MENDKKMDKETAELFLKGMQNMRLFLLKSKNHIKKYIKYRKLHGEVIDSMQNYISNGNYNLDNELNNIEESLIKEAKNNIKVLDINLDFNNDVDYNMFLSLTIYKNHSDMRCVIDDYLDKHKFRNAEKISMLNAMKESFSSFFKVINKDFDGFVEVEDLITNKRYKIIDIALSSPINKSDNYVYTRLITIDEISFFSGTMVFPKNIGKVNNYIKNCKHKKKSSLVQLLEVYHLNKEYGLEFVTNNIK